MADRRSAHSSGRPGGPRTEAPQADTDGQEQLPGKLVPIWRRSSISPVISYWWLNGSARGHVRQTSCHFEGLGKTDVTVLSNLCSAGVWGEIISGSDNTTVVRGNEQQNARNDGALYPSYGSWLDPIPALPWQTLWPLLEFLNGRMLWIHLIIRSLVLFATMNHQNIFL